MEKIYIEGGRRLYGEVEIHGAKNSVLPILAATLLSEDVSVIHNCPELSDVEAAAEILTHFGCRVTRDGHTVTVDPRNAAGFEIPLELMRKMRSSVIFLGAMLGRLRKARMSYPGGCELGPRPIDLHIGALRKMGVIIEEEHGFFNCYADDITGTTIHLTTPSVGATENILLAGARSKGTTTILNAAREPEIEDLAALLGKMGADIRGAGTSTIVINGVSRLTGAEHTVIPDRIEAATYLLAAAGTGGEVTLKKVSPLHIQGILTLLEETGCTVKTEASAVHLRRTGDIRPARTIETQPYPGFPTDSQAIMMAYLTKAKGTSLFVENIFDSRYKHVPELLRMGADIKVIGKTAVVYGVRETYGAEVECSDLRGGAALVLMGLSSAGTTEVGNIFHIDRGYERMEEGLRLLGAEIQRK